MYFEDVRGSIITRLNDATAGLDAQIVLINTARGEATPVTTIIDPDYDQMMSYQVFVDFGPDTEMEEALRSSSVIMRSVVPLTISTVIKDGGIGITKMRVQAERYNEAILKCLDGYKYQATDGDYYCVAIKSSRTDNNKHVKQTTWESSVNFNVHIGKL